MEEITLTGTAAGNATLVAAFELRAGSQGTTEWQDGAADVSYPGGGPGTLALQTLMALTATTQHRKWQSSPLVRRPMVRPSS